MARHREHQSGWLWILPSLVIPLVIAAVAWTGHVSGEGEEIAPNVRFAGIDLSGASQDEAATQVADRESEFLNTTVTIDLGERTVDLTAEEIGYDYLYTDTVSELLSARHEDGPWKEFVAWVSSPFEGVTVNDFYTIDEERARQRLAQEDFVIEFPVEPQLSNDDASSIYAVPGTNGVGVDADFIIGELQEAEITEGPVEISAEREAIPPTVTDQEAREIAVDVNDLTQNGFVAVVGDETANLTPGQIRRHLISSIDGGVLNLSIDVDGFQEEIEGEFPEPIGEFEPPVLEVVDGDVVVLETGTPPPVCCSTESVERAAEQLLDSGAGFYRLLTRPDDNEEVVAWADGSLITEPVAEFTTNHPCCENRVTNIQTMAEFMQGKYLIPGETLSMNEYVGPRTREKGYLAAGAIRSGYMTDEVGGGVSQFITTIFNAAFYGGLDLDQYQSHSIYFSRYPFGREATLSIPGPDLVFTNNTDYPVLIWPTWDDTSITVTLYSTENVDVVELEQRVSRRNQCRHSAIDRQRTFSDGRVVIDTIVANYRPGNGLDCNGNQIPQR